MPNKKKKKLKKTTRKADKNLFELILKEAIKHSPFDKKK